VAFYSAIYFSDFREDLGRPVVLLVNSSLHSHASSSSACGFRLSSVAVDAADVTVTVETEYSALSLRRVDLILVRLQSV